MFKPSNKSLTDRSNAVLLLWIFFFAICVSCHTVLFVPCSLLVTCWERTDLLAILYVMFFCVFVTVPYDVLGQVWYLIVWIPGPSPYFEKFPLIRLLIDDLREMSIILWSTAK